jgi:hypothetical protein
MAKDAGTAVGRTDATGSGAIATPSDVAVSCSPPDARRTSAPIAPRTRNTTNPASSNATAGPDPRARDGPGRSAAGTKPAGRCRSRVRVSSSSTVSADSARPTRSSRSASPS